LRASNKEQPLVEELSQGLLVELGILDRQPKTRLVEVHLCNKLAHLKEVIRIPLPKEAQVLLVFPDLKTRKSL
jgi:hypothetical protein